MAATDIGKSINITNMAFRSFLFILLSLLVILLLQNASADIEPNDTIEDAEIIHSGTISGTLNHTDMYDYYNISNVEGDKIVIKDLIVSDSSVRLYFVFGHDFDQKDEYNVEYQSEIYLDKVEAKNGYIEVTFDEWRHPPHNYSFDIEYTNQNDGNSGHDAPDLSDIDSVPLIPPGTINGHYGNFDTADTYKIKVDNGLLVLHAHVYFEILNQQKESLFSWEDDMNSRSDDHLIPIEEQYCFFYVSLRTGGYHSDYPNFDDEYAFTFTVVELNDGGFGGDAPNTREEAFEINIYETTSISGSLCSQLDESDYFRFSIDRDLVFMMQSTGGNIHYEVYDKNGEGIKSYNGYYYLIKELSNYYYIGFSSYSLWSQSFDNYSLNVEYYLLADANVDGDAGNTFETASDISNLNNYNDLEGTICYEEYGEDYEDYFKLEISEFETLFININTDEDISIMVFIYDDHKQEMNSTFIPADSFATLRVDNINKIPFIYIRISGQIKSYPSGVLDPLRSNEFCVGNYTMNIEMNKFTRDDTSTATT